MMHEVPWLYRFHKQHHRYIASIGFAAEFTHGVDNLVLQLASTAYLLPNVRYFSFSLWLAASGWLFWETTELHAGYTFDRSWLYQWLGLTYSDRTEFHDFHHSANQGNYGSAFLWDYVFGTMDPYLAYLKRHHRLIQAASPSPPVDRRDDDEAGGVESNGYFFVRPRPSVRHGRSQ